MPRLPGGDRDAQLRLKYGSLLYFWLRGSICRMCPQHLNWVLSPTTNQAAIPPILQ